MARVGLVLGAGGPVGHAFHVGTLAALANAGWDARDAEMIVGTSIGAVTGALLRGGLSATDLLARVEERPLSPEGVAVLERTGRWPTFVPELAAHRRGWGRPSSWRLLAHLLARPWLARPGLALAAAAPVGMVSPAPIAAAFSLLFDGRWPPAALRVCAVDLDTGARAVFGTGRRTDTEVGAAIAASSAVPSFFEPVAIGGRRYVDGGLHSPANADAIADVNGLEAVVVSLPMGIGAWPARCGVDIPGRVVNHRAAVRELRAVRRDGCAVILFEPGPEALAVMGYNAFELRHRRSVARAAFESVRARVSAAACGSDSGLALVVGG